MPFYETIFETGTKTVAEYANDDEAANALSVQHGRAKAGLPGGPTGHPAERVKRVLVYEDHPGSYGENYMVSTDVAESILRDALKSVKNSSGVVSLPAVTQAILLSQEAIVNDTEPHDSVYKMEESRELDAGLWEGE